MIKIANLSAELISIDIKKNKYIEIDLNNGLIAKWHDESHLNWWYANFGGHLLNPEYCFDEKSKHLTGLLPRVIAVDKVGTVRSTL